MRTFGNGNKGRSGPNTGRGRSGGNRFPGRRKPSPADDGTGFRDRAEGGKREDDASRSGSFGGGRSGRREDRPFNRSYNKPFDKSSRPYPKSDKPGEAKSDSHERPFRGREDRPSRDTSNRSYGRREKTSEESSERPYRGRSERSFGDSHERPYGGREDRPSRDTSNRPYGRGEKTSEKSSERPYRGRSERSFGDSHERPYRGRSNRDEDETSGRPFGRKEKPLKESNEKPYRGRTEKTFGDSSDRPFKGAEKPYHDSDYKPRRNRFERQDENSSEKPFRSGRSTGEPGERPFRKPFTERGDRNKPFERPRKDFSERPKRQFDSDKVEPFDKNKELRLNKYISNCGYCSRREADTLISAGAVKVNGVVVSELGSKVLPSDKVQIGDVTLSKEISRYILLNKPKGYITTSDDPYDRKTVMALLTNACRERIYPVGRLDRNTTGLLLFTNDGDLAKKLTHPKYGVRKVYHVTLDKALTKNDMLTIAGGVKLEDEPIAVDEIAYVNDDKKEIGIEIHSGQNRVVRRIFESLGYDVEKLDRVVFANLTKKDLPRGKWRPLEQHEINTLRMSL
ncbi:MAG: pseudouridine synthase [Bacteroidota bacterium]|nr:pseudouridine synthase [Bacteroidota bacterium]